MTDEEKRTKNAEKSRKRRAELQYAAERDGFEKASEAITAWKNGEYVLVGIEELEQLLKLAQQDKPICPFCKSEMKPIGLYSWQCENSSCEKDDSLWNI